MRYSITNQFTRLDILVLITIVLIGLIHLPFPFDGDQALFTIGALKMSQGGILYRDFWDLKQPGIYSFYLLAGVLFGFNEVGIHTFELLYMAGFSVVLIIALKRYYRHPSVASLVPLLTVGTYYGVSGSWHLTQLEALVGFPMFLSLWFAYKSSDAKRYRAWWLFLSGLMGGIVLLFKFIFLPILAAFWFTTLIDAVVWKREQFLKTLVQIGVPVVLGTLLPLLIIFSYFAHFSTLNLLYQTFFEYPPRIVKEIPAPGIDRLIQGLKFTLRFAPLMPIGLIGAYASLRRQRDLIAVHLVCWFILGLIAILLQRQSWWQYHYLLLFVPLGILAAKGLDVLWEPIRGHKLLNSPKKRVIAAALSLTLLFSVPLSFVAMKSFFLVREGFALKREQQLDYQSHFSSAYPMALKEVTFLASPESLSGNIYVCGDPLYYFFSGRNQAIAINGWALEFLLPEQWKQLQEQLSVALPVYIFVSTEYIGLIPERSPELVRFIEANYRILHSSNVGLWYVVNHPA